MCSMVVQHFQLCNFNWESLRNRWLGGTKSSEVWRFEQPRSCTVCQTGASRTGCGLQSVLSSYEISRVKEPLVYPLEIVILRQIFKKSQVVYRSSQYTLAAISIAMVIASLYIFSE